MQIQKLTFFTSPFSILLLLLAGSLLAACTQSTPPLAAPGQPTLVFIYTDA